MKFNDVAFSIHGFFVAMIFVCQCIAYERGQQTVSGLCKFILFGVFLILGWLIYNFSISILPELKNLLEVFISFFLTKTLQQAKIVAICDSDGCLQPIKNLYKKF